MAKVPLLHAFSESSQAQGRILNYVWINAERFTSEPGGPLCGVPLHYIDQAIENARRYQNVQVNIWLDTALLDQGSIEMVNAHIAEYGTENIALCDLQDIPNYKNSALFNPHAEDIFVTPSIWGRVDLARLIVINHCLETTNAQDIFYSDFDVRDVMVESSGVLHCLTSYGMVFGATDRDDIENGYMGFRRERMGRVLFDELLSKTKSDVEDGFKGFPVFFGVLLNWADDHGLRNDVCDLSVAVLERMHYVLPKKPEYEGLCVA